jgi:hypothetical protein
MILQAVMDMIEIQRCVLNILLRPLVMNMMDRGTTVAVMLDMCVCESVMRVLCHNSYSSIKRAILA